MVIFCAILPVPPQADPAPRPDGEDVAKGVLEPREGVDGRAPRISSGLEGLRYTIPRARPPGLILPDLQVLSTGPRGSPPRVSATSLFFALGIFVRGGNRPTRSRPLVSLAGERRPSRGGISAR